MEKKIFLLLLSVFFSGMLSAQVNISGLVTGDDLVPLSGAAVMLKGTTTGASTDADGKYTIMAKKGDVLEISFIGMIKKSITVGDEKVINVRLASTAVNLDEVVAIGYGTSKKSDLTGAVTSIKPESLANAKIGTAGSALQGLAAGVFVTTGSVKPGGDASIIIRGQGSLRAGNAPLYIVDGMPVEGGLQDLSPNDIESIEILKDASSASIYGSRGSNGVILVTTKKGTKGKGKVSFNATAGTQRMLNKQDLMNAQQYYDLSSTVFPDYKWTSEELRLLSKGKTTDWQDAITQDGSYRNYNLSVSGGSEKAAHYLGVDWYDQKGTIKNSSFNKATVRYNLDAQTTDWLKSGIRFNVSESSLKNINEEADSGYGTMFSAISSQPTAPIFTDNGDYFDGFLNTKANPVAIVDLLDRNTKKTRAVGSMYFEIQPLKNLKIRSENGAELEFFNVNSFEDGRMGQHYAAGGHATKLHANRKYSNLYFSGWRTQIVGYGRFLCIKDRI
jgi:TonB-linked SusC/RagA family outer membrane protein